MRFACCEIEERAPHFRFHRELLRLEREQRRLASRARRLHPPACRVAIEDVPARVQADDVAVVEIVADFRIALAVDLVAGERLDARLQLASVDDQLLIFHLDLELARLNFVPVSAREGEAFG